MVITLVRAPDQTYSFFDEIDIFNFPLYLQTNEELSANKFTIPIKMKQYVLQSNYVNSDILKDSSYYDGGPIPCPIF